MKVLVRSLVLLACSATLAAAWPDAWRNWRYGAPILVAPATPGGLAGVLVPRTVTDRARRNWMDLRVIDDQNREVPYVLRAQFGGRSEDRRNAPLLEPTTAPGAYRQVIADAGENPPVHNTVMLTITTDVDLLAFVQVAVSTDMKQWNVIRDRAPIYLLKDGRGAGTTVAYPDSRSHYVRIRVLDGSTAYKISSATIGYELVTPPERVPVDATLRADAPDGTNQSVWTSEGDLSHVPIAAVQFTTRDTGFARVVHVTSSDDGDRWTPVTSGEIQVPSEPGATPKLTLSEMRDTWARRWRIVVANANNAPIADLQPVLLTVPRRVVFRADSGRSYRLLFGHPTAAAPAYDLPQLTDEKALAGAAAGTLGAEETNAGWVDPTPWTERYEAVLWTAMAAAGILLGLAAVRALRARPGVQTSS